MIFEQIENLELRTDASFTQRSQIEHHTGNSPLDIVEIGMVSQVPLDYMHLVCLGIVKKLMKSSIKSQIIPVGFISNRLQRTSKYIPLEFARKCRALDEIDRLKATEFRLFLLYLGPVILHDVLSIDHLFHFNALHCVMRILSHPSEYQRNNSYAHDLLVYFVKNMGILYGQESIVFNVHGLLHIAEDCRKLWSFR